MAAGVVGDMVPDVLWMMLPLLAAVGRQGVDMSLVMHWMASTGIDDNCLVEMGPVPYDSGYYPGVKGCGIVG